MAEHTFDLAAALVDKAVERLNDRTYGRHCQLEPT